MLPMNFGFSQEEMRDILERFSAYWQTGRQAEFGPDEIRFLESYFLENDPGEKLQRVYDLGIALFPSEPYFLFGKARWSIGYEDPSSTQPLLDFLEVEYPGHFETRFLHFLWLAAQGRNSEATKDLRQTLHRFAPLEPEQSLMVSESLEQLGMAEPRLVRELYQKSRQTPGIHRHFFLHFLDRGITPANAEHIFEQLIEYFPNDTDLMIRYAEYLKLRHRQTGKARSLLESVLENEPDHATAHLLLAEILEGEAMYPAAIYHYLRVLKTQDPSAGIFMRLGVCHEKSGDVQRAEEFYRLAVYEDPAYLPAWHALVQIHMQSGNYDKALQVNIEAVEKIPNAKLLESLGYLYLKKERFPSALKAYQEAFRLGGRGKNLLLVLHDLYLQAGLRREAGEMLEMARKHYGNDPEINKRFQSAGL